MQVVPANDGAAPRLSGLREIFPAKRPGNISMTAETWRKSDAGKGERARRILRPLAPEMSLAEIKLPGAMLIIQQRHVNRKTGRWGPECPQDYLMVFFGKIGGGVPGGGAVPVAAILAWSFAIFS